MKYKVSMSFDERVRNISAYPLGSEWRRWDLHIHTLGANKNDSYSGSTPEEKWGDFYKNISEYVGDGGDPSRQLLFQTLRIA